MLCVSRSANLTLPILPQRIKRYENGEIKEIKPPVAAVFERTPDVPEYARTALAAMPDFLKGVGKEEDPYSLCGIFDTRIAAAREGWDDETLAYVEEALAAHAGGSYLVIEKPKTPKPWPNYDKVVGADDAETAFLLTKKIEEDGFDVRQCRAYERENGARELVLTAYEALIAEQESDVIGVISA